MYTDLNGSDHEVSCCVFNKNLVDINDHEDMVL